MFIGLQHIQILSVIVSNDKASGSNTILINLEDIIKMDDAELQQRDHRGFTMLMAAAEVGCTDVVEHLIGRGEDLNFEVEGETAASLAFTNGHHEIVLSLIKNNAKFPINYNHEVASEELKAFVNALNLDSSEIFFTKILNAILIISFSLVICLAAIFYVLLPTYSWTSWSTLTDVEKVSFVNIKVNFYGVDVRFKDLFANDSEVYNLLSSEQIKFGLDGNFPAFSETLNSTLKEKIFLSYSNMTDSLREHFLNWDVNFQGKKVQIKEILNNFEALNFLTFSEVRETFEGHLINISSPTETKTNFFIDRYFIDEEIEIESIHYKNDEINEDNPDVKNFSKILSGVEESKVFILSSIAGEGKSSTFRHFAVKLKEKNPQNWIQFVDLKKHFGAYKKGDTIDLKKSEELLNFFTSDLLNLNKLESEIFKELFGLNRVIFFWDGIDEISPLYKNFMLDLTSTVKKTSNNFQFISTRPQFSKDFREKFNVKAHKLMPLEKSSSTEYLYKIIAGEKFYKNVDEFWKKFQNTSNKKRI
jgi:hypothetical protein